MSREPDPVHRLVQLPPLALYIHLPWCVKKCPYCDFNSHAIDGNHFPEQAYVDALIRDLDYVLPDLQHRKIVSIFFGGGTPSLFSAQGMKILLSAVYSRIDAGQAMEITMEANPGTVDSGRFAKFRETGINRLSIGIQSFNNTMLKALGRIHDGDEAANAFMIAKSAGFEEVNLDLMYGLPDQQPGQPLLSQAE